MKRKKDIVKGEPLDRQGGPEGEQNLPISNGEAPTGRPNVFINTLNLVVEPFDKHVAERWHKVFYHPFAKHYHERYRSKFPIHARKILVIDLILLTLAALGVVGGILAYYVLPAPLPYSDVRLEIISPREPMSGRAENLVFSWSNDSDATVACATVRIVLEDNLVPRGTPEGGRAGASPCLPPGYEVGPGATLVPLGDLRPSSRGLVTLPVYILGTPDLPATASAEMIYWKEGSAKLSHIGTRRTWALPKSALALAVEVPEGVQRGRDTSITVRYSAEDELPAVAVLLETPEDFRVTGTEPARSYDGTWSLPKLKKGAAGQFRVYGRFAGREQAAPTFTATALYPVAEEHRPFASVRVNADPRAADLALKADLTYPSGATAVRPGEELRFTLHYRNLGETPMHGVSLRVDDAAVGLILPVSAEGFSWDSSNVPELAELAPSETGELPVTVRVRDDIYDLADGLRLSFQASYRLSDSPDDVVFTDTVPMDFYLAASPRLTVRAAYYTAEGDQLGLGPLPPKVGETTKYWIFVKAEAVGRGLNQAVVEGYLEPGVTWTGRASSTSGLPPRYDASTGRITWEAGSITPGTALIAGFEVAVTPTEDQAGQVMNLATDWRLKAKDAIHAIGVDTRTQGLDTDLAGDSRAAGKGEVEP